jgi:hypothetical protein
MAYSKTVFKFNEGKRENANYIVTTYIIPSQFLTFHLLPIHCLKYYFLIIIYCYRQRRQMLLHVTQRDPHISKRIIEVQLRSVLLIRKISIYPSLYKHCKQHIDAVGIV